jgi:hypothetical protein
VSLLPARGEDIAGVAGLVLSSNLKLLLLGLRFDLSFSSCVRVLCFTRALPD